MKRKFLAFLLVALYASEWPLFAQDQKAAQVTPTVEQTLDFLNNHRHGFVSECVNSEYKNPQGYIRAAHSQVNSLDIDRITSEDGNLVFKYSAEDPDSETKENTSRVAIPLRSY